MCELQNKIHCGIKMEKEISIFCFAKEQVVEMIHLAILCYSELGCYHLVCIRTVNETGKRSE